MTHGEATIEVSGYGGVLFDGPATPCPAPEGWDWSIEFRVSTERVAQFQARRGEEVALTLASAVERAWIGDFRFESDATATGTGGHGRIQLVGRGSPPAL